MFLRSTMDVEELGRGEDPCPHDGLGRGHMLRGGEEAEEEAVVGLPRRQPEAPQLVGVPVLLLRDPLLHQCSR